MREEPVLLLGLAGFSDEQRRSIQRLVDRSVQGTVTWRIASASDADAWWLNGARSRLLPDGMIRVAPAIPQERAIRWRPDSPDRPVAFCEPLPAAFAAPVCRLDLTKGESVRAVLDHFAGVLGPRATELALAAKVLAHEGALHAGFCHLVGDARLLAVVDPSGSVGIAANVCASQIAQASWTRPPAGARHLPESFAAMSVAMLMWQYAGRSTRDLLPARYRVRPIYFRRPPRLPDDLIKDAHLAIMRELLQAPATFAELRQQTELPEAQLARDLSGLYFAGSITTDVRRAVAAVEARSAELFESGTSGYSGLQSRADAEWFRTGGAAAMRQRLAAADLVADSA